MFLYRQVVSRLGIEYTFADPTNLEEFKNAIKPNTKVSRSKRYTHLNADFNVLQKFSWPGLKVQQIL